MIPVGGSTPRRRRNTSTSAQMPLPDLFDRVASPDPITPSAGDRPDGIDAPSTTPSLVPAPLPTTSTASSKRSAETSAKKPKAGRVIRYKLADGTLREKHYPPHQPKPYQPQARSLGALLDAWQRSPEWNAYAETTKVSRLTYLKYLRKLEKKPLDEIEKKHIIEIRNSLAAAGKPAAANEFHHTVSALFSWANANDCTDRNPTRGIKPIKCGHLPAWTMEQAELAMERMPEHLRRVIVLALYTGQRRDDLGNMRWDQYDGEFIRLVQGKTKRPLVIPCHPTLRRELDYWRLHPISDKVHDVAALTAGNQPILLNIHGNPWVGSNGRSGAISVMIKYLAREDRRLPERSKRPRPPKAGQRPPQRSRMQRWREHGYHRPQEPGDAPSLHG